MNETLTPEIVEGYLPLDALKLRLAAQQAPWPYRRGLSRLAEEIEQGQPLDAAFERRQATLPRELRCLIAEALQVAEPTTLILDALRLRQAIGRDWTELVRLIAYPLILLVVALLVGVLFSYVALGPGEHSLIQMYEEFGFSGSDALIAFFKDQYQAINGLTILCGWTLLTLVTLYLVGPRWGVTGVVGGVPLVGRPLRWISMREVLQRYALFLARGLPMSDASQAVSRSMQYCGQAPAAMAIAARVAGGTSLGQALCSSLLSDGLTRPSLRLIDLRGQELPQALEETANLLGRLVEQRCRALGMLLPLFSMLMVGTIIWALFSAYLAAFMPMVSMITSLA